MRKRMKAFSVILTLLSFVKSGKSQDYGNYQSADAVLLQVGETSHRESSLNSSFVALSDDSRHLNVKLSIPRNSFGCRIDDSTIASTFLPCSLTIDIDQWQIQDYLTSAKPFAAKASLTLNNITKPVSVEYIPTPAGTEMDGPFSFSMTAQFKSGDFSLCAQPANSEFIVKVNDATINRR